MYSYQKLGYIIIASSFVFLSACQEPNNRCECQPKTGCECEPSQGCMCKPPEQPPEIEGFTFSQVTPLRAAYAVNETIAGRLSDPIGGSAPFTYSLVTGNGNNDTDNIRFNVSGNYLKISEKLEPGAYRICIRITDSKNVFYDQAAIITIENDPITKDQETRAVQGIEFKMRFVPSGVFIKYDRYMADRFTRETISTGYWMAETLVTQELYQSIMGENPSRFFNDPVSGEKQSLRPVENISWVETILFCNRLSVITGREPAYKIWGVQDWEKYLKWIITTRTHSSATNIYVDENANGYRLPTVNEWIWACMGADILNPGQINYDGAKKYYSGGPVESLEGIESFAWQISYSYGITHEVGLKHANELGLFDMTGNVTEIAWNGIMSSSGGSPSYPEPIYESYDISYPANETGSGFRIVSNQ